MIACPHCAASIPHHTNSLTSIGGPDRFTVWDLHWMPAGDLAECLDPERSKRADAELKMAQLRIHYREHTEGAPR